MDLTKELYNETYKKKYMELATTPLGQAIYAARWALVMRFVQSGVVLDYGSGPGAFNAHGPDCFERLNYDINPTCGFTEKVWQKSGQVIDVLTMWDSIEHDPNFYQTIKDIDPEWLFITTPNLESLLGRPILGWTHYRPGEHIFYFDRHSLRVILEDLGYEILEMNFDEGRLRRPEHPDWILTVVAKKRA